MSWVVGLDLCLTALHLVLQFPVVSVYESKLTEREGEREGGRKNSYSMKWLKAWVKLFCLVAEFHFLKTPNKGNSYFKISSPF